MVDTATGEIVFPFVRSPFNYDVDEASSRSALVCLEESKTQQQFAEEADINTIVERFGLTGQLPENVRAPVEGDFTSVTDYQSAMNVVRSAQEAFMEMPAGVRAEFGNDPGRFMDFIHNPKNVDRAIELGIAVPRETPKPVEPMLVRVVPEVSGGGTSST